MAELLLEIIFYHILPRLPVKSLPCFMCVCKLWESYLLSSKFSKIHLHHINNNHHHNHSKLIVLSSTTPCTFRIIDCEAPDDCLTPSRPLPFEANREHISLLTSQNGLVCVGIKSITYDHEYSDFILWNPLRGDYKILSKNNSQKECFNISERALSLSYNSSEDDYKLLRVTNSNNVYIYSLKFDSWMKVDIFFDGMIPSYAVLNDKSIYFLEKYGVISPHSYSIKRFDLTTKKLIEIATLSLRCQTIDYSLAIKVTRGWVVLFVYCDVVDMCNIKSCMMDVKGCWREGSTVTSYPKYKQPWYLRPLHYMRNGNWLMHSGVGNNVCVVDMKNETKKFYCSYTTEFIDIPTDGKFVETFESPNQYMK